MEFLRRHWPVVVLLVATLLPVLPGLFSGKTIGPFDQVAQFAPWHRPAPKDTSWNVLQVDGVLQFYPWRKLALQAWGRGELPLWNPYQLCGTPLLANSQSGGLYPPHILFGLARVPTGLAVVLLAWFHLAVASLGARALALRLGANEVGGLLAGLLFGLSPFMLAWLPLASVPSTVAWAPWCLAGVLRLFQTRAWQATVPWLALPVGMTMLAGHLQFAAYVLLATFLFAVAMAFAHAVGKKPGSGRALLYGSASLALGVALSAGHLLPVLSYSQTSHRRQAPSGEGWRAYSAGALTPIELAGVAFPSAVGTPDGRIPGYEEPLTNYWPAYLKPGANYAEGALMLGPLVCLLFGLRRKEVTPEMGALAAVAGLGLLVAMGPGSLPLYFGVPGWAATGSPGRALVIPLLALSVLIGTAWPGGIDPERTKRTLVGLALLAVVTLAVVANVPRLASWLPGLDMSAIVSADALRAIVGQVLATSLLLGVGLALLFGLDPRKSGPLADGRLRAGLTALVLALVFRAQTPGVVFGEPLDSAASQSPPVGRVAFVNRGWGLLVPPPRALAPPNTAVFLSRYDVGGYDSLLNVETVNWLKEVDGGQDPAPSENGNMMFVKPSFEPAKLMESGVTEVWSGERLPQLATEPETREGTLVYRLPGPGRVSRAAGTAQVVSDSATETVVRTDGTGPLVLRDRNLPGWTATVDGRPVAISAGFWRQVDLPDSAKTVVFRYWPPGLATGLPVSIAAWTLTAALVVLGSRRRRELEKDSNRGPAQL